VVATVLTDWRRRVKPLEELEQKLWVRTKRNSGPRQRAKNAGAEGRSRTKKQERGGHGIDSREPKSGINSRGQLSGRFEHCQGLRKSPRTSNSRRPLTAGVATGQNQNERGDAVTTTLRDPHGPDPEQHLVTVQPTKSGRRWRAMCSCGQNAGLKAPTQAVESASIEWGLHHLRMVRRARRAAGEDHFG